MVYHQENERAQHVHFELGVEALLSTSGTNVDSGNTSSEAVAHFETHLGVRPEDPAAQWYRDNARDWAGLMHSKWGLAAPLHLHLVSQMPATSPQGTTTASATATTPEP